MNADVLLGAVAYDPKVVTIWDGFRRWFGEHDLCFDYVLYSNYERQVEDLVAGRVDVAWNSPLAWIRTARLASSARAVAMRDSDRDLTSVVVVRADSPVTSVAGLAGQVVGTGAVGGTAGIGASIGVSVALQTTEATIGSGASVVALGLTSGIEAITGFQGQFSAYGNQALAVLPPRAEDATFRARYGCAPADVQASLVPNVPRFSGIASIIMLSWNAPEFTRMAVESIRTVTRYPHEIIVVDNGSDAATCAVLAQLAEQHGVRVVYNGTNLGFGAGMNVGMAHARGDVLVLLNNDVIVTEGWLEDLVGALERRRSVGCTAPRSNRVASPAQVDVSYVDTGAMHRWAAERRRVLHGRGHYAERVVVFCMCLDRKVIEGIGGFDPRYAIGNFEDDDLSVRVRAAGWEMFVCDDVFIHHFGSVSFQANAVDYRERMEQNWRRFCDKWGLGALPLYAPYDPRALARGGCACGVHYIPLPAIA